MDWQEHALPTLKSTDDRVKQYMARLINPISPRRRWVTQRAALNSWMYHGRQWIDSVGALSAGQGVYHFREISKQSLAAYKRPVTNIIAPAVDNEVARLTKKEYVPETATSKRHQDWLAAARLAKDYVTWQVNSRAWGDKREQLAFNLCVDETAIARSFWDEDRNLMEAVGAPEARKCPSCEAKLASPQLPHTMLETGLPSPGGGFREFKGAATVKETGPVPQGAENYNIEAVHCPMCGESELEPYDVEPDEAAEGADALGNPLGRMLPKGDDQIEVVSVHEYYPENGGIGVEPYDARVHHQMTARPIEEVLKRYPQLEGRIQPDDPQKILRLNPLYSDPALVAAGMLFGLAAHGMDSYQNHVLVEECVVEPDSRPGLEEGAHFVKVNENVLSRPLCIRVNTEDGEVLVPRVKYHIARQKRVPGMFWGRGFVSDLVPLQRRLNELDAQVIDLRERGKPMIWKPMDVETHIRKDMEGSFQFIEYESDSQWSPRDGVFPGVPMTGNPYMEERNQILVDAQLIGTPQDIELGRGAGGIKTTSGMMLAQEQAGERRAPKERGLVGIYEGIFQHVLDMSKTFRKDPVEYRVETHSGLWEMKAFDATELRGTVRVRMRAAAGFDQALYDKEAASEAVNMGLYRLDDPLAVQAALEYMRLPADVNENQKVQIRRAEMAWSDFMREMKVPQVDVSLYEPVIWFKVFQKRWMDDECLILQQRAEFEPTWSRLTGWEDDFDQAVALDFAQRAIYEQYPPEQWNQVYAQAQKLYTSAVQQAQEVGLFPPGPPPEGSCLETPPPPPPAEGFLPKALELRIFTVWERMLGPHLEDAMLAVKASKKVGVPINDDAEKVELLLDLLRMRSVIEAFRKIMEAKMMAALPPGPEQAGPEQPGAAPEAPPAQ